MDRSLPPSPAVAREATPFEAAPFERETEDVSSAAQRVEPAASASDNGRIRGRTPGRRPIALAGTVLQRMAGRRFEVALVLREGRWCLPRVVLREGEERRDAARRAARSLCGWSSIDDAFLGERTETLGPHDLSTWWWRAIPLARDPEFGGAAWTTWLTVDEALHRLDGEEDRDVLRAARVTTPPRPWRRWLRRRALQLDAELAVARAASPERAEGDLARAERRLARLDLDGAMRSLDAARATTALDGTAEERARWRASLEASVRTWPPGPWVTAFEATLPDSIAMPDDIAPTRDALAASMAAHAAGERAIRRVVLQRRWQGAGLAALAGGGFAFALGAGWLAVFGAAVASAAVVGGLAPGRPLASRSIGGGTGRSHFENDARDRTPHDGAATHRP